MDSRTTTHGLKHVLSLDYAEQRKAMERMSPLELFEFAAFKVMDAKLTRLAPDTAQFLTANEDDALRLLDTALKRLGYVRQIDANAHWTKAIG